MNPALVLALLALVIAVFALTRGGQQDHTSSDSHYIRGTELYRESLEYRNVAPPVRLAKGLPAYHDEAQWRDPPR